MRTTILNQDYSILCLVGWQKGMILLLKGVVQPIEFWDRKIKDGSGNYHPVPKIVVVHKYVKYRKEWLPTKRNIFLRDDYTCQYCGSDNPPMLTLDHIKPRSRGGRNTWENLVTSCYECNCKKGCRTPNEADMKLLSVPQNPRESLWAKKGQS